MEGSVIGETGRKYRFRTKIGSGSFGEVYVGTDLQTGENVAIKMESVDAKYPYLYHEYTVYGVISGVTGIPNIRWFGPDGLGHYILVMDFLGPTLGELFKFCGNKFSLKTVLMLADQLIERIEHLHTSGYLHRDLKPQNFLMGIGQKSKVVHMIDFGLAKGFRDRKTFLHIPYNEKKGFAGTALYASINSYKGVEQSRRDDMESLGYLLMFFLRGSLPWQDDKDYVPMCLTPSFVEFLCNSHPREFASYFHYCRTLGFEERPDYAYLKRSFRNLFVLKGFKYDNMFDWTILKQQMAQSSRAVPRLLLEQTPAEAINMVPGVKDVNAAPETVKSGRKGEPQISTTPQH